MPWPPIRFHQQLVLVMSALLLVAMVLLGGYTAWAQYQSARQSLQVQASTLARFMVLSSGNLILTDSLDQVETLALHMVELPDVQAIRVLDAQGRSLTHVRHRAKGGPMVVFDPPGERVTLPRTTQATVEHVVEGATDHLLAWHPVVAGELVGWVQVTHSTVALSSIWQQILRSTLVVAVMAVALCGALLALILRQPMSALAAATRFAVNLGHSQGRQMPVPRGPLEVAQLSEALNDASARLQAQMLDIQVAVDRLREHEGQLEDQNEQLDAIFTLSPDGLVTFDRGGQVRFANHAFMLLTGLEDTQVLGRSMAELDEALAARISHGEPFPGLSACLGEPGARHHKGVLITVARPQTTVIRLLAQRSATPTVALVLYAVDVTQQHQLDMIKSEFLSMAAHELRTPMASIYGFTELMMKREMAPEMRQDVLGRIYRQSQQMINILNELLDLARIESRRGQDFEFKQLPLQGCVSKALADFKVPEGREPPELAPLSEDWLVRVDAGKFQQALGNVLSNAYKYSPQGGSVQVGWVRRVMAAPAGEGAPRIEFFDQAPEDALQEVGVVITDHGMGLKPDELARMGERFFRADKSGNIPGTGLGVSIVRELMDLMGGHFEVQSRYGEGTSVTLWLPLQTQAAQCPA
jgi:two-component system, OmpR family, sensor histidine kinase VicK